MALDPTWWYGQYSPTDRQCGPRWRASSGQPTAIGSEMPWSGSSSAASAQSPADSRRQAGGSWRAKRQSHHYAHTWHDYSFRLAPEWRPPGPKQKSAKPATGSSVNSHNARADAGAPTSHRARHDTTGPNQFSGPSGL
ncbi:MAG: hypothetical protein M1815_006127 [Lichina confinis]|nr:MAG: hypothetical protein M1815_006127 [Lichina confinis]